MVGGSQQRLRFDDFGFQRLSNGRCRAKVQLSWTDGRVFQGESDATVIIVSLSVRDAAGARRLVGSFLTDADPPRGAALAVLNATNRIMGNYFTTR